MAFPPLRLAKGAIDFYMSRIVFPKIVVESEPPVRVILDVGAQVLEWKNEEVVREWIWTTLRSVPGWPSLRCGSPKAQSISICHGSSFRR